jgi:hypothetical protein
MKKGGNLFRIARILGVVLSIYSAIVCAESVSAASLYISPASGRFPVGQTFKVVLRINTAGQAVNASEGTVSFDPSKLQIVSLTSTGSIFNMNVQEPEYSNSNGTIRFAGVILNPGYTGTSGGLLTITFRPTKVGDVDLGYSSGAALANDGQGTNVTAGLSGATYTIIPASEQPAQTPQSTPATAAAGSLLPDVSSPTHPDQSVWYANNDPEFKWPLPQGVDGVSYLVSAKSDANPGNESDGIASSVKFTDVADGASYFHIKFHTRSGWGPIRHFSFNVDTGIPETFTIVRLDEADPTNPNPKLSFVTTDKASGIARYVMKIGDGDWFAVDGAPTDHPYSMPHQAPGDRDVVVEAVDRAGNGTRSSLAVSVKSITVPVITQYPSRVPHGEGFQVSGTADPGVTVRVEARPQGGRFGGFMSSDVVAGTVDVPSDAVGHWTAPIPVLKDAVYRLRAVSIDRRLAVSDPSLPVVVRVGYGFIERMFEFFRAFPFGWSWISIIAWLLVIISIVLIITGLRQRFSGRDSMLIGGLKKRERQSANKLQELLDDINDELLLLIKVARHRPLYPEEKYLKSKLLQYQRTIRFLVKSPRSHLAKRK